MRAAWSLLAACVLASPALAADADSTAGAGEEYFTASGGWLGRNHLEPYGDLRLRADDVWDRPGTSETLRRQWAILRGGLAWVPAGTGLRIEAGAHAGLSSEAYWDPWVSQANEAPDTLELDRLAAHWTTGANDRVSLGKMRQPLRLGEMQWDDDLRPLEAALTSRLLSAGALGVKLAAAAYTRSRLPADDAHVGAAQLTVRHARETVVTDAEATYLQFENMDEVARRGLGRQNELIKTAQGPDYAHHFRVADLQLNGSVLRAGMEISARVDLGRNTAIGDDRDGVRTRLALGRSFGVHAAEIGWAYQRIEREALPGAFNSDDWWFHTRMRGNQFWVQGATGSWATLRVVGTIERRDDLSKDTRRMFIELRLRIPER